MKTHRVVLTALAAAFAATPSFAQKRELNTAEQVAHVASRLTFGPRYGDADRIAKMGVDRWIAEQLRPDAIADSAVGTALAPLLAWSAPVSKLDSVMSIRFSSRAPVRVAVTNSNDTAVRLAKDNSMVALRNTVRALTLIVRGGPDQFAAGKVVNAEKTERQLLEVITDFWENHFSVYTAKMPSVEALAVLNRDAIRPRALGKFRDLLGAVAHSTAMLYYLDNHLSTVGGLNENYARELLELHTLGVDGGYTQQDVIEVARALTGWSMDPAPRGGRVLVSGENQPPKFTFMPALHDTGTKSVLGHTLAAGRGIEDGEEVLDIIARHPSTAGYIATKLVRRLVSDDPPRALVDRAADTFMRTDGDIAEVVRTIVMSDEFFSRAAFRAKAKTPFEFIVSARRSLDALPDTSIATARTLTDFGQPVFGRQSPDGWPDVATPWITAGSLMRRVMFASDIAANYIPTIKVESWSGWTTYADKPAKEQAAAVIEHFLGGVASMETRTLIASTGSDEKSKGFSEPPARLRGMIAVALGSPEFQRR
ncbi:MAG TPA: DUF1800 domain-containing protein [Gemmatimonadaceae bacterium]|nr:DUF1800 domain-containing protein [Gemmatimonadaceae bacterium]